MNIAKILARCAPLVILTLAACETPEDRMARETQFNGKPITEVVTVIGAPKSKNAEQAVWSYKDQKTNYVPVQSYINGKWVTVGTRTEYIDVNCTFTATLENSIIVDSVYEGNDCYRYAPKV